MRCGRVATGLIAVTAIAQGASAHADGAASGALSAVEQLFDGMRAADEEMVRAVFAPGARFAVLSTADGAARIASQPVDSWIEAVAGSGGRWNEQIYDVEIRVDGDMASAWTPYTFYLDGALRHCGVNSIELLRDARGWRITQLSDTRRTEGCPDPLGSRSPGHGPVPASGA